MTPSQLAALDNTQLDAIAAEQDARRNRLAVLKVPHRNALRLEPLENIFLEDDCAKAHIVKGIFAWGETSAWIAPPGGMKSALLASAAMSIALDHSWFGRKSAGNPVGVVYFALERADLVKRRLIAHRRKLGLPEDEPIPIVVVGGMLDMMNPATVPLVVDAVSRAEQYFYRFPNAPGGAGVLIFDTLAKMIAAGGGDENSAKDQGKVFANLQMIKDQLCGPHIALIGHTGKDEARGARGSNALYGDVDLLVTISGDAIKTATVTKANDAPEGPLFSFESEVHEFGMDEDGDPITVNIVMEADEAPANKTSVKWAPGLRLVRDCVSAAILTSGVDHRIGGDGQTIKAAPVSAARATHAQRYVSTGEGDRTEAERKAWQRNFKQARSAGLISGELADGTELIWLVSS